LELGRDADTGGQVKYVLDLSRRLATHKDVDRVDLFTRQIFDAKVGPDYAVPVEQIGPAAQIVRRPCGPRRYLRKEVLWPYLDSFVDQLIGHMRDIGRMPDVVHGHYADGGYVGLRVAGLLGVPFIFSGHSLGRVKRRYLLEHGRRPEKIDAYFRLPQRIEAEEEALDSAAAVVASTQHEIDSQYVLYDHYRPSRKVVIPPGTDLEQFRPDGNETGVSSIEKELLRFLRDPDRPMILTLARPDERKNLDTLVRAYAENDRLRETANLVIVAGNRDDIRAMESEQRRVLNQILLLIDAYDLYGSVALPKHHEPEDVPVLYRLAMRTGGVFVLPTMFEMFGLTLIEAAATGLPIVATSEGGPKEIIDFCGNGLLIDPQDSTAMGVTIESVLARRDDWQKWSENGMRLARERYSWETHVEDYVGMVRGVIETVGPPHVLSRSRLTSIKRMVVTDIDNTLVGDEDSLRDFLRRLDEADDRLGFGVATGRTLEKTLEVLEEWSIPTPDIVITSVGSEIYYGGARLIDDRKWAKHINYRWEPDRVRSVMASLPGVEIQEDFAQRPFKISYYVGSDKAPSDEEIRSHLRKDSLSVNAIFSHGEYLDLLPIRASKGRAVRYVAMRWRLPLNHFLVAGDSGNDIEMLAGDTLGVVVSNHSPEVEILRDNPRVLFAEGEYAAGIVEGMKHYGFFTETDFASAINV
jgi:sucrose-phosphate synthase